MPADQAGDYGELKAAILRRYNINEETYRQRFRTAKLGDGETPRELATRLCDLALRLTKDCHTAAEVRELVVKEQLLNTLPEDVRLWVSERNKPTTSAEAGQLAEDYLQARKMTLGKVKPESETRSEQRSGEIPKKCQKCGRQGHWTHDCWSGSWKQEETNPTRDPPKSDKSIVRCFTCQQRGHYSM